MAGRCQGTSFGAFDYWRGSRMMPTDLQGITEFPFFTFLFADLHAHLMALPFTLLALGLALAVVLARAGPGACRRIWGWEDTMRLAALGIAVGSLRLINAWDFPVYLAIGVAAILLAEFLIHGGFGLAMLVRATAKSVFMFGAGYLAFLPFHLSYETFFHQRRGDHQHDDALALPGHLRPVHIHRHDLLPEGVERSVGGSLGEIGGGDQVGGGSGVGG